MDPTVHSIIRNQQSHDRHRNLAVYGYTRKIHTISVPDAIQQLIVSYYSLWITRKFTKKDLEKVMHFIRPQPINIHIHRVIVDGAKLDFSLKLRNSNVRTVLVELLVTFQSGIESIGGHFDFVFDQNCCEPQWNICYAKNAVSLSNDHLQLPIVSHVYWLSVSHDFDVSNVDITTEIHQHFEVIKTYIALTEIKWKPEIKKMNFNIIPSLGISAFYQIPKEDLEGFWSGERKDILAEFPGGLQMKCRFKKSSRRLQLFADSDYTYPVTMKCQIGRQIATMKLKQSQYGKVRYLKRVNEEMIGDSVIFHAQM